MDYRYFSAARYQQEAIDTDMLAALRQAGTAGFKMVINSLLLMAPPIKLLAAIPGVSTILDAILRYVGDNYVNLVLRPIRDLIELDPQYEVAGTPVVEADANDVFHIGDPPGLFGVFAPWEPGGFAAGYGLAEDATNRTEINQVEILTKRHTLTDLWDGQGLAAQQYALERRTYEGISSRLVNAGMQPNTGLDLAEFRTNINQGRTTGSGLGFYSRKEDDYALSATSLLGSRIQLGTNVLNPGFGGGILMTDLDTARLDTFYNGSIAWAPKQGDFTDVFDPAQRPSDQPTAPVFDPDSGLQASNAGQVTFSPGTDGISRYTFAALPAGADGLSGLRVTYRGQDTLMADGTTPQHIADARDPDYYRVTDRLGQPITASVITGTLPAAVTAKLPSDWTGPSDPLVTVSTAAGVVDLDLSARVEAAPPNAVTSARDTDSGHVNATRLSFLPPAAVARLRQSPPLFGSEGPPASGGDFQAIGGPTTDFANLAAPGNSWVNWQFVAKAAGDDYNRDGQIQASSVAMSGNISVWEAPEADKEAVHAWADLVRQYVPSAFRLAQPVLTGNDSTGQPYGPESWNTAYRPDGHVLRDNPDGSPYYVVNQSGLYAGSSPPPPDSAENPYFWSGSDGYQYITIWDGAVTIIPSPQTDAERIQNGRPDPNGTPPARIRAVLRLRPGDDTIEVLGDGSAVLLHRETQLTEVPVARATAMFADLQAKGYTQGRAETDTAVPPLYDLAQNPQPSPPLGTPGDFTIVGRTAGGNLQVAFTKPYEGLVTVPPNRDDDDNPLSDWWTVNGWYLAGYNDPNPAQTWTSTPAGKLQDSPSNPGMIWGATVPGGQDGTHGQQLADRVTVAKTFTVGTPASATTPMTGQVLPGETVAINLTGANAGTADQSYQKLPQVRLGTFSFTLDNAVTFAPDEFTVTLTNSKGTVTLPSVKADATTGELRPVAATDAVGMANVVIPSDLLAGGDNTVQVEVRKGGIYQRYCRSEPPTDQTDDAAQRQAGYWVSTQTVTDRDGNSWPAGNLFYENRMVGDGSGRYVVLSGSDVIHYNSNPFGPGVAGLDSWQPVEASSLTWKPDSYDPARTFDMQWFPIVTGSSGGYQLKSDIKAGVRVTTTPNRQTLHTYSQETVDRYRYDPATQSILDVLPPAPDANTIGPLWEGGPDGHRHPPAIVPPSAGHRNELYHADPAAIPPTGAYVLDAPVTSGQNRVGAAPVGQHIDRTNRQVFGSDDNLLVRYLYAAMKIVDVDGTNEDGNGNGLLDAGEDGNQDGLLQRGLLEGDGRLYREYRDAFNMGYLDHLTIVGSAVGATGGSITSTVEMRWRSDGDGRTDNDYRQNYEYYASETDRAQRRLTTKRHAELLMASYHAYRSGT
jgi:hypothetical protein